MASPFGDAATAAKQAGEFGIQAQGQKLVGLLIDRDLLKEEFFGCHPCINSSSLKIRTSDVTDKIIPAMHHEIRYVDLPWEVEEA